MQLNFAKNANFWASLLIVCFALAVNINGIKNPTPSMGGDEYEYDLLAYRIVTEGEFSLGPGQPTAHRTPGFPIILGAIYSITGHDIALARVILIILTSFTPLIIYWICLMAFGDKVIALIGGLSWGGMGMTVGLAGLLYGESFAALVLASAILFSMLAKKNNSSLCAGVAGVLMGFAILIRGYLILVLLGPFIWLLLWKKRLAIVVLLFASVLPSLWVLRNSMVLQVVTLSTQTPKELWSGNNAWTRGAWAGYDWLSPDPQQLEYMRAKYIGFDKMSEADRSRCYGKEFIVEITTHPRRIAWLIPRKIFIYLSPASYLGYDWVYAVLLPFSLIGIAVLWKNQELSHWLWLFVPPVLGVMLICVLTFGDARFRHPVNTLLAILSAYGLKYGISLVLTKFGFQINPSHHSDSVLDG